MRSASDERVGSPMSRRAFLRNGSLIMAAASCGPLFDRLLAEDRIPDKPALRIGLVTDVHYADKPPAGSRHYRESPGKLRDAVAEFNRARVEIAVELGDFIDAAESVETEVGYLKRIESEYARFSGERHHVLGNHCVWTLTKREFLETCGAKEAHYSFDRGDFHFVILDACYRRDGEPYGRKNYEWTDTDIPAPEREWLAADLSSTEKKTLVFIHQRLDVANHYGVKSAPQVREILEKSGKVLAVFQGHNHLNDHKEVGGIHYCTIAAMVEGSGKNNNAYGIAEIFGDGTLRVDGFHSQKDHDLRRPKRRRSLRV